MTRKIILTNKKTGKKKKLTEKVYKKGRVNKKRVA